MNFIGVSSVNNSSSNVVATNSGGGNVVVGGGAAPVGVSGAGLRQRVTPIVASRSLGPPDNNHNRLISASLPLLTSSGNALGLVGGGRISVQNSGGRDPDLDGISLFDDIDFSDKPKEISDCLDDLADLIEEKSVKPMLAAVAPANMMMAASTASTGPKMSEAERRRYDAVSLLKSLSVPDPLLGQLVHESMTGFILVVDAHGLVDYVSDFSTENVGHTPQQIQGNTIYNFLHPADHSRFGCHLVQQQSPPTTNTDPDKARRNFTCRFKLNNHPAGDTYINLYVACITVRRNQESAETSRLLCVARKLSEVSPHPQTIVTNNPTMASAASGGTSNPIIANATELFTTKQDPLTSKVMHADTSPGASSNSRLRASVAAKTLSMVGKCFLDFCHPDDRELVKSHFTSTLREKQHVSRVYRMTGLIGNTNGSINQRLSNVVHVQTRSKYHKTLGTNNAGFIVSTHSIVGDVPTNRGPTSAAAAAARAASAAASASAGVPAAPIPTSSFILATNNLQPQQAPQGPQGLPVVMMPAASTTSPKISTLSSLLSTPPNSTVISASATVGSSSASVMRTKSSSPPSASSSPASENSEEAKNQLLKQLLNSNFQPNTSGSSGLSTDSSTSPASNPSSRIMKLLNSDLKYGVKRPASSPLDNAPVNKVSSVVCSENPSLTELLEKPPNLSITVPPPVPTKWHQEPREKLPKDIMRKFLPPHPAERAAKAAAAAAAATAASAPRTAPTSVSVVSTSNSALFTVLTSRSSVQRSAGLGGQVSSSAGPLNTAIVYTANSSQAGTATSASTSRPPLGTPSVYNLPSIPEDKDDMLSDILDGLIDFQERGPSTSAASNSATPNPAGGNPGTSRADEKRISDIERFLVNSERSLYQGEVVVQRQQPLAAVPRGGTQPKMSSLAASTPSLTSILSAPPLATPSGRSLPVGAAVTVPPPKSTNGAMNNPVASSSRGKGVAGSGNAVNLVPRMNELLQQVPPNVSIPDTPDLDSLILLQERRRRMSSGGSVIVSNPPQQLQPQGPSPKSSQLQPGFNLQPNASPAGPVVSVASVPTSKGQLLMQHLTSSGSRSGHNISLSRSVSYLDGPAASSQPQFNAPANFSGGSGTPQILARRSSFSGSVSPVSASSSSIMSSPPPSGHAPSGAQAAAAAAVAAASAGVMQPQHPVGGARPLPQRHASGGTIHHAPRPLMPGQVGGALPSAGNGNLSRRLSDSVRGDDRQRSLLQQLLSE